VELLKLPKEKLIAGDTSYAPPYCTTGCCTGTGTAQCLCLWVWVSACILPSVYSGRYNSTSV